MDLGAGKGAKELSVPKYVQKRSVVKQAVPISARSPSQSGTSKSTGKKKNGTPNKRKRRRQKATARTWIVASLLVLIAAVLVVLFGGDRGEALGSVTEGDEKILEGIYIDNVYVGGKTADEARAQITELAHAKIVQAGITLTSDNGSYSLSAEELGLSAGINEAVAEALAYGHSDNMFENARLKAELKETGKNFTLSYSVKDSVLLLSLQDIKSQFDISPEEPHAVPSLSEDFVQSFTFYDGKNGYSFDVEATANLVKNTVTSGELNAQVKPVYAETPPTMTLDFIKENTERISTYTTRYRNGGSDIVENRVFNIQKATDILNCHVVSPGETFSYNEVVGPRTTDGGWKEANGISGGKEYTLQAGGGVCQTSTTLYNALLCGNLNVTDRSKHSIPSDYVDKGLDATVDTSGIDLKFLNDTGAPIYIFMYIKPDPNDSKYLTVTASFYGKPLPQGVQYKPRSVVTATTVHDQPVYTEDSAIPRGYQLISIQPHDGFTAEAYLDKYVNDVLESSKYLHTDKYRGNAAEIRIGTGDPAVLAVPPGATLVTPTVGENADGSNG
ncbi:MAG TPA: VanW family protein [Clostridia bacterium]|nr:VanW family protein [Clostridia bacterium]